VSDTVPQPVPQNEPPVEPQTIAIRRGPHIFYVLDSPQTRSWNFWDLFRAQWEPTTLQAIDDHLPIGGLLWDIGAWVGPVSLWAAVNRKARVVALEPDPVAYLQLLENVRRNGLAPQITTRQLALSVSTGNVPLHGGMGDTRSSLTVEHAAGFIEVAATTPTLLAAESGVPDLIKMDIEGGESRILPQFGQVWRRLHIPMILSLHPQWYAPRTARRVKEELAHWDMEDLHNNVWYCEPHSV
jgi:FkbM family methyltransferase